MSVATAAAQWRRLMALQRDEARRQGVAFEVIEQAPEGTTCADCGFIKIGPVALVAGHYVCSPWCARQVIEGGAEYVPLATDEPERCSSCGLLGCASGCEQGRDDAPACEGCEGGCIQCAELDQRDEPTEQGPEVEAPEVAPGDAPAMLAALVVGSRFEVKRFGRWLLARVAAESVTVDGAGSLFPSAPVRVLTVETIPADGGRGDAFVMREDRPLPVRLVEVGLFE
jgi:hypothetical protein